MHLIEGHLRSKASINFNVGSGWQFCTASDYAYNHNPAEDYVTALVLFNWNSCGGNKFYENRGAYGHLHSGVWHNYSVSSGAKAY